MRTVTFYSYKGGVGRTLLLAWCARELARRGHRALALDLDLEAPGLHYKLQPAGGEQPARGVVDLLDRFSRALPPPEDLADWCLPVESSTEAGGLWLLPAGAAPSGEYWRTLSGISWEALFRTPEAPGARFFLWLCESLESALRPDFLFVDSRTGVTEMGAAAMGLLADDVVAVLNTSPEALHGTREVLRATLRAPRVPGRSVPRMTVVLSRLPVALPADDELRLLERTRAFLVQEADPLAATLQVAKLYSIHQEDALLTDESRALAGPRLRIHDEYASILARVLGEQEPEPSGRPATPGAAMAAAALAVQQAAVDAYMRSYARGEQGPELAVSLLNLSSMLLNLGRREDAIEVALKAVGLYQTLADARPDIFWPDLKMTLDNLDLSSQEDTLQEIVTERLGKKGRANTIFPSRSGSDEGCVDPPAEPEVDRLELESELEKYRRAKERALDPSNSSYRGKHPLLPRYDRELVERWERDPTHPIRLHGRELSKEFEEIAPGSPMARNGETLACRQLAAFLDRVRRHLNRG